MLKFLLSRLVLRKKKREKTFRNLVSKTHSRIMKFSFFSVYLVWYPFHNHCLFFLFPFISYFQKKKKNLFLYSLYKRIRYYTKPYGKEFSDNTKNYRGGHQRCSIKKGVLRSFTKFTGKHLTPATLLKEELWHKCFPVNFAKFLKIPFQQKTPGRLHLELKK